MTEEERNRKTERMLLARTEFFHRVKNLRRLQKRIAEEQRATETETRVLQSILKDVDATLERCEGVMLAKGYIEADKNATDASKTVYKAVCEGKTPSNVYFTMCVFLMRQWQKLTKEGKIEYGTCSEHLAKWSGKVDEYLEKGNLYDQLTALKDLRK